MTTPRWQFSLLALLVLMAVTAMVVAFSANYPMIALVIAGGTAWVLFESGVIVHIVIELSKPSAYARHPFLAAAIGIVTGAISLTLGGFLIWRAIQINEGLLSKMAIALFATFLLVFACFCMRLVWLCFKGPDEKDNAQTTSEQ